VPLPKNADSEKDYPYGEKGGGCPIPDKILGLKANISPVFETSKDKPCWSQNGPQLSFP